MDTSKDKIKKKAEKILKNQGSIPLATLEALMDTVDKLEELKESMLENKPQIPTSFSFEGIEAIKGEKGDKGEDGKDADEEKIINSVLKQIPTPKDGKTPTAKELLALIKPLIPKVKDGKDADETKIIKEVLSRIELPKDGKDGSPDTAEQIADKLESLKDDARLDIKAIKGIEKYTLSSELESTLSKLLSVKSNQLIFGSGNIEVFNSIGKVGSGSALKFIGGAIVTNDGHTSTIDLSGVGGTSTLKQVGDNSTTSANSIYSMTEDVDTHFRWFSGNAGLYFDESTERIGLNSSSPNEAVQINGGLRISSSDGTRPYTTWYQGTTSPYDGTAYVNNSTSDNKYIVSASAFGFNISDGKMTFLTAASGTAGNTISWTERVRITNDGYVGIGVTPTQNLHIKATTPTIYLESTDGSAAREAIKVGGGYMQIGGVSGLTTYNTLYIGDLSYAGGLARFDMNSAKVGFGTNFPIASLSKVNIFHTSDPLRIGYNVNNYFSIAVGNTGVTNFTLTGASPYFRFNSAVGVGTNPSGAQLDVQGDSKLRGLAYYGGSLHAYLTASPTRSGQFMWNGSSYVERISILAAGNVGIGTTSPNASAILQLSSTSQGFLPPVMTGAQAEAISSPATGLMVYATSAGSGDITTAGWWGYNGSNWIQLG